LDLKIYPSISYRAATISYQLSTTGHVQLKLYNALGQEVRTLVDESKSAGSYQVRLNGTDNAGQRLSAGVYFCRFQAGATSMQKRLVFLK